MEKDKSKDIDLAFEISVCGLETLLETGKIHLEAKKTIVQKYGGDPTVIYGDSYISAGRVPGDSYHFWFVYFKSKEYPNKLFNVLDDYFKITGLPNGVSTFSDLEIIDSVLQKYGKTLRRKRGIITGKTKIAKTGKFDSQIGQWIPIVDMVKE